MATPYPSLFDDAPYQHDGADGLPLITDRASDRILVYTPGHLCMRLRRLKWTGSTGPPAPAR